MSVGTWKLGTFIACQYKWVFDGMDGCLLGRLHLDGVGLSSCGQRSGLVRSEFVGILWLFASAT